MKTLLLILSILLFTGCSATSKYGGDFDVRFGTVEIVNGENKIVNTSKRIIWKRGEIEPRFGLRVENKSKQRFSLSYFILKSTPTISSPNYQTIETSPEWNIEAPENMPFAAFITSDYKDYTKGDYIFYAVINGKTYRQIDFSIIEG